MKDAYQNGFHIMDRSSLTILNKSLEIINKSKFKFKDDPQNGNNWKYNNLVKNNIWFKHMVYRKHDLLLFLKEADSLFLKNIIVRKIVRIPNTDRCLQEIVNSTDLTRKYECHLSTTCWNDYFKDGTSDGYLLSHKLLLLQVARARKCFMNKQLYDNQIQIICSSILSEVVSADAYERIDDVFDLFLEQVLLCGYEGFTEFLQNKWLYYILEAQRCIGCFSDVLGDPLKTRIKKDMTYFEDGCNDHTTGLGSAVLALYYNFIVKQSL